MANSVSILVVDDERVVLNSCRAILSEQEYHVETASSGEEGLRLAERRAFDVALIDLKMPGMPGMDLLSKLAEVRPKTIRIVITGFATVETAIKAMKQGAFEYICKPFTPDELEAVVGKALENRDLREAAEQAQREKERFILTIYHQLKSPVGVIKGYVNNLLKGVITDETEKRNVLERCLKRSEALLQSLEDLLSLSQLKSRKIQPKRELVKLEDLVRCAAEGWNVRAQEKGIQLRLHVDVQLPPIVADREQIEHLFANLLDNALRYNKENGSVELKATVNRADVRIDLSDTGIGIAEADIAKIFDEFYRCQNEQTRSMPGTGLGLSIVKEIVEAHGGRIEVRSEIGKGTTFTVWLPLRD